VLQIQNSHIFLKNPYKKNAESNDSKKLKVLISNDNITKYITKAFPNVVAVDAGCYYKCRYDATVKSKKSECFVEFHITEVVDTHYLDVVVKGKTTAQIVSCLEEVQARLLKSGIKERYIDILSYDAVSEYYCNKIYPKLNTLERNLRKLLFNIYIVNFGVHYFEATFSKELQNEVKGNIHAKGSTENKETERLQNFFYSLDYGILQKLLFTPTWTDIDQKKKDEFLSKNTDLSKLSDEKLRERFLHFTLKSDWERFFSEKINIENIEQLIKEIGRFRNMAAHFKFFSKIEYVECSKLIKQLNKAVLTAIKLTEDKDFSEKNSKTFRGFLDSLTKSMEEFQNMITKNIVPVMTEVGTMLQKTFSLFNQNNGAFETIRNLQEIILAMTPKLPVFDPSAMKAFENAVNIDSLSRNISRLNEPFDFPNSKSLMTNIPDETIDSSEDVTDDEDIADENTNPPETKEDDDV